MWHHPTKIKKRIEVMADLIKQKIHVQCTAFSVKKGSGNFQLVKVIPYTEE